MRGSNNAISIVNFTDRKIDYFLQGQILTSSATELIGISNSPSTNIEYLKKVAGENHLYLSQKYADNLNNKKILVRVISVTGVDDRDTKYTVIHTIDE